ncbi:mycothione reductase [Corynebacterium bovis]|uniref:mycothione reductase n=1 Tax=Corynebacterium bovis TaxID=36808 RepID=UPI003139E799
MATHYDLVIVGTGSGNSIPGPEFDDKSVAIIEKGVFGGTCINVGCIPTKMYVYTADVAREVHEAGRYGISASGGEVDWDALKERVFGRRIDPISAAGRAYRAGDETPNITFYDGEARFTGERTLEVNGDTLTADQIVLATGGRSRIPDVIADSGVRYRTNVDVMRMDRLPRTMTILGGGIIAVEFAAVFSAFGVDVTLVNRSPVLLRGRDATVSERFTACAAEQWTNHLGRTVSAAREETRDGRDLVVVTLDDGTEVASEELLVAMGRVPNGDTLDAARGGVELRDDNRIVVDEYGRTTAEGVWSLGDASSPYELKHVANAEARAVAHNLLHPDDLRPFNHDAVPGGIFTHPQIAYVGMTEEEARASGRPVTVKVQEYSDVAYGWAMEDTTGFCKLIADSSTRRLLGAHIMGPQAATLIQLMVTAIVFDLDLTELARGQYWPHPALTELLENALLGLEFTD